MRILRINMRMPRMVKNNEGTALLMTLMILASVLTMVLGASGVITQGIIMNRTQERSTKAYFAAEAGAERSLWKIRKSEFDYSGCADSGQCLDFELNTCNDCAAAVYSLSNNAAYNVEYSSSTPSMNLSSLGKYLGTRRTIAISFSQSEAGGSCTPACGGIYCGDPDGCGGFCFPTCNSSLGCSVNPIANAAIISGLCCSGNCYKCVSGYVWDGSNCVQTAASCLLDFIFPCVFQ